jgi:V8-like Glu-specific endopeptidase
MSRPRVTTPGAPSLPVFGNVLDQTLPPDEFRPIPPRDGVGRDGGTDEVIIGVRNLRNVAWLARGVQLAAAVGRILINGNEDDGTGTGFLVGEDLFLTNHHVLRDEQEALGSVVQFNYQRSWTGQLEAARKFRIIGFERSNEELDYTLVRIERKPGNIYGWLDPSDHAEADAGDAVFIVQHPRGAPKQIAIGDNRVTSVFGSRLQYTTDTEKGSSGSPVFNSDWQLVGLHHKGGELTGPNGVVTSFTNQGIRFAEVIRDVGGLLGGTDPLYELATGAMRHDLLNFLQNGADDVSDTATTLLGEHPALRDLILEKASSTSGRNSPTQAVVASGVAMGVLLLHVSRNQRASSTSKDRAPVAAVPPGPSLGLVSLVAVLLHTEPAPAAIYAETRQRLLGSPAVMSNLVDASPGVTDSIGAVTTLLTAASAGAQAAVP